VTPLTQSRLVAAACQVRPVTLGPLYASAQLVSFFITQISPNVDRVVLMSVLAGLALLNALALALSLPETGPWSQRRGR
jgi:hypothetical protein